MQTLVELDSSTEALIDHLASVLTGFEFKVEDLRLKFTGPDRRIGWAQSWYVYFEGFGVVGMSDEAPRNAPDTAFDQPKAPKPNTIQFRKHFGNFQKSIDSIVDLPATTEALLAHLSKVMGSEIHHSEIRMHKRKDDRRIGWYDVWMVYVDDFGTAAFLNGLPLDLPHSCITVEREKVLTAEDQVRAECFSMAPVPNGMNAYQIDSVRSGVMLSAGWEIMFEMSKPVLDEVVLVNQTTGQRILVKLEAQSHKFQ
jgi:hypothetical protein